MARSADPSIRAKQWRIVSAWLVERPLMIPGIA
jgi:hypothetical protein